MLRFDRLVWLALVGLVACRASGSPAELATSPSAVRPRPERVAPADVPSSGPPGAPAPSLTVVEDGKTTEPTVSDGQHGDSCEQVVTALDRLYCALGELEARRRTRSVRILWLGDSHTAADFWPGAFRARLEQKFGIGGPGFVHVGLPSHRHSQVKVMLEGPWRVEPHPPCARSLQQDGVFGLGGMRTVPLAPDARAVVSLGPRVLDGPVRWIVLVRPEGGSVTLRAGERSWVVRRTPGSGGDGVDPIATTFEADPALDLTIEHPVAQPRVFGVIIESISPGIVVDTLGINGARLETPLVWAEGPWVRMAAQRSADLVIVAYGTNEVFDALAPERYRPQYEALLARIRRGVPNAACWLVGPSDVGRGGDVADARVAQIEAVQRSVAEQNGCLFFGTAQAMGGAKGFERWLRESPPLAVNDGVHLAPAGYRQLGEQMASVLLEGYSAYLGRVE